MVIKVAARLSVMIVVEVLKLVKVVKLAVEPINSTFDFLTGSLLLVTSSCVV